MKTMTDYTAYEAIVREARAAVTAVRVHQILSVLVMIGVGWALTKLWRKYIRG